MLCDHMHIAYGSGAHKGVCPQERRQRIVIKKYWSHLGNPEQELIATEYISIIINVVLLKEPAAQNRGVWMINW